MDVTEIRRGVAGLDGSFNLCFLGFTTADISFNASADEVQFALRELDPIPYDGGVVVTRESGTGAESMWRVTFVMDEVGGNVESLRCLAHDMRLLGNGAGLAVYSDGKEGAYERRDTAPSVMGNEVSSITQNRSIRALFPSTPHDLSLLFLLSLTARWQLPVGTAGTPHGRY